MSIDVHGVLLCRFYGPSCPRAYLRHPTLGVLAPLYCRNSGASLRARGHITAKAALCASRAWSSVMRLQVSHVHHGNQNALFDLAEQLFRCANFNSANTVLTPQTRRSCLHVLVASGQVHDDNGRQERRSSNEHSAFDV